MMKLRSIVLASAGAISLATILAACGSYSSPTGNGSSGSSDTGGSPASTAGSDASGAAAAGLPGTAGADTTSGGMTGTPGGGSAGMPTGAGGDAANGGAQTGNGGASGGAPSGGAPSGGAPSGGAVGTGGGSAGGAAGGSSVALPCDILTNGGVKCVSAHSTVRVIVTGYAGPLYQVCKGTAAAGPSSCKGTTQDITSKGGYADAAAQDTFCAGTTCTISKIYDQSGMKNDLEPGPAGGAKKTPDNPAVANALKITISGHDAYGILIKPGLGYRTGCTACNIKTGNGMATGDQPQTLYWVTSQQDLVNECCFDYGNAETSAHDDGNGTMEALYFGGGVVWGTGTGGVPGPWIEADLENGLFAGWENNQNHNISTNKPVKLDFVSGVLLGDTADKNNKAGRFALYAGDATTGALQTMYDGVRPPTGGYAPMKKQGSIILGIGGDNSDSDGGRFYEGAIATGPVVSKVTVDALQAAIVTAKYGK